MVGAKTDAQLRPLPGETRVMTLFFSDIEGSTRLLRRAGDAYGDLLMRHREIVRDVVVSFGGLEQGTEGDSFFVVFDQAAAACAAAFAVHRRLAAEPWPAQEEVRVRIGLHSGEIRRRGSDWVGLTIHEAARIGNAANGGQTLLSEATQRLAGLELPGGAEFSDLGPHRLKDIEQPIRLYQLTDLESVVQFPPPRSLEMRRHNLPVAVTSFVGRANELAEITSRLGETRLLTLVGPGGTGKSRLALEAAAGLLDACADGVWLVQLAPVADPELVAAMVGMALGVREESGRPIQDTLADAVGTRELLVILDNCEHLVDACARLTDHLLRACQRLRMLATSRAVLRAAGETVYRVPAMPAPPAEVQDAGEIAGYDAVRLFTERASASEPTFQLDDRSAAAVASICRQLDGIPLAIELATGRLRAMSATELHDRLDQRFRLLTGGNPAGLERHQTLRATIDWSYRLLAPREQLVLDRLSVFSGGWYLDAAEAATGDAAAEDPDLLEVIGELVDKSLVQSHPGSGPTRYDLLETIRQYAALRLLERGTDEQRRTRLAHVAVYLALAEDAEVHLRATDQGRWLERLDIELANLRRALAACLHEDGGTEVGLRIAVALRRYWRSRGLAREAADWLTGLLERLDGVSGESLRIGALICAGEMYSDIVDYAAAQDSLGEALERARRLGDPALAADALRLMSWIEQHQDKPEQCAASADEAVSLAEASGESLLRGHCLLQRANLWSDESDIGPAMQRMQEALEIYRAADDRMNVARALNGLALERMHLGELEAAAEHLEEALTISVALQDDTGLSPVRINLGFVWILRGQPMEARPLFVAALEQSRRSGRPDRAFCALLGLAVCASQLGQAALAAQLHGATDALVEEIGLTAETLEANVRNQDVDRLREEMGAEGFMAAYAQGRKLPIDDAVALAMRQMTWSAS